ncbi:MAG TPA: hypothetical protein VN999_14265 [Thermoanaerobaculia bacterium]|nr:hypothetical protein [Thermoanaerobaculia bacterium]
MIEIHRCVVVAEPACAVRVRREEPALASFHPLLLAVCRRTRRFPDGDPIELGLGIRAAALGAAEAVLAGCELRGLPVGFATALVEAVRRLRELAYCIEIARRLGYLSDQCSAELLALHGRTLRAVSTLAQLPQLAEGQSNVLRHSSPCVMRP